MPVQYYETVCYHREDENVLFWQWSAKYKTMRDKAKWAANKNIRILFILSQLPQISSNYAD